MIQTIKNLLGMGPQVNYKDLVSQGATIIDVRSKAEFQGGHIKGSVNIPLDTLKGHLTRLKKDKPVITCCASGMRSSSAKSILKSHGFEHVYNGGGWTSLKNKLN